MPEQEVQQPTNLENPVQEATDGGKPTEGQIPSEPTQPDTEVLKANAQKWEQLEKFCNQYEGASEEINKVVRGYLSGDRAAKEAPLPEAKFEAKESPKQEKKEEAPFYEDRIQELERKSAEAEKKLLESEIDLTIKKMAENKKYGVTILEKQGLLEKAVLDLGLVPALRAKTLSLQRAFELAWKDMDYDNQLTKGQNQVISEIEEKRGVQGPSLQRSNVTQMVAPKPKTFKEALLQAEKDLGYTIEEAKEALYRR